MFVKKIKFLRQNYSCKLNSSGQLTIDIGWGLMIYVHIIYDYIKVQINVKKKQQRNEEISWAYWFENIQLRV